LHSRFTKRDRFTVIDGGAVRRCPFPVADDLTDEERQLLINILTVEIEGEQVPALAARTNPAAWKCH